MNAYPFDGCPHGCPCGYLTDTPALKLRSTSPRKECHCTPRQVQQYLGNISGPLLDRIDIQVKVLAVNYRDLRSPTPVSRSVLRIHFELVPGAAFQG